LFDFAGLAFMIDLLSIIVLGLFLGMRHATDPDHVIAVTAIVARHRSARHAAVIGFFWGIGHALTILCFGSGIFVLGWVIPARIGIYMEFSVGMMLILLGGWNLSGIVPWFRRSRPSDFSLTGQIHVNPHSHGDYVHTRSHGTDLEAHPHLPEKKSLGWLDRPFGSIGRYPILRPLIVGIVHGFAGSAAVALLVLTTIQNVQWAIVYLLVYGFGTIVGMMLITVAIALPFAYTKRSTGLEHGLRIASGLISLGFGFFIVYQIVVVAGLFGGNLQWTTR
jgi:high-affinity nickel permease